jgi:ABC-type transport system substrate-binding protein
MGEPKEEDCYNNDELTQLLIDGAKEPDAAKREKMYQRAEEIVAEEMPRLPIVWPAGRMFLRKEVKGYEPVPFKQWYHLASIEEE